MEPISEERLAPSNPEGARRVRLLENILGFPLRVTFANRTADEQTALWSQGRVPIATVNILRAKVNLAPITVEENEKVTNAPPYHSWHEYAMAWDVVPLVNLIPDWNTNHPSWQQIVQTAPQAGLRDGISWKDEPHLQPEELPLSPTPVYISMLQKNVSLQEIWDYANLKEFQSGV